MTSQRHEQAKTVFLAACELGESQVAAFLDRECADDPDLRREVESLLRHHFPTTIFGDAPPDATARKIPRPELPGSPPAARDAVPPAARDAVPPDGSGGYHPGRHAKPAERFPPGSVIAGRYRMLGRLGRGGMGEVFRADDLKLDQPVALKFLSRGHADDPAWLDRLRNEVRLARRVTHPNVNRIYDIAEAGGEAFISMEYVDGEDLASLLRRIGRVAGDKAIQIAGQLCAGLGAAHDQGVLHRDLKPANVMIDGRGRVRITDFGIAAVAPAAGDEVPMAGTPAYMAPELFDGRQPSVRSDLYSLGVVLYELATGKEPFDGASTQVRGRPAVPEVPSAVCSQIDPALERVIVQCLDPDPRQRPASAYAVAAALPGGDLLSAAVAAGETPSPEMVAAAGSHRGMPSRGAVACLVAGLLGLAAVVLLADRTFFLPQAGLKKAPAALEDRAQTVIKKLGHEPGRPGSMQGFTIDRGYLDWAMEPDNRPRTWVGLADARPPAVFYWYRRGDTRLLPPAPFGEPALLRKLPAEPGMITVRLDGQGRLLWFAAMGEPSKRKRPSAEPVKPADWTEAFRLAELNFDDFDEVQRLPSPPMYADCVEAWEGTCADGGDLPLRIEAASLSGRVVYFHLLAPWQEHAANRSAAGPAKTPSRTFGVRFVLYMVALIGGAILARRNLKAGRGDRLRARRVALLALVLALLDWIVGERHVAVFVEEAASMYLWLARSVFAAAASWIVYIAVEPYVRRFWPQTMITWSRMLEGRFRDPLVGRDVLVGAMLGVGMVLVLQFDSLLPGWLGQPQPVPKLPGAGYELGELLGMRYKVGTVIGILLNSVSTGLVLLVWMLILRIALRAPRPAALAFFLTLTTAYAAVSTYDTFLPWATGAVMAAAVMTVLTRVGLVAVIVGQFVSSMLRIHPVTADPTAWYAAAGNFAVVVVALLLCYGFHASRATRARRSLAPAS